MSVKGKWFRDERWTRLHYFRDSDAYSVCESVHRFRAPQFVVYTGPKCKHCLRQMPKGEGDD